MDSPARRAGSLLATLAAVALAAACAADATLPGEDAGAAVRPGGPSFSSLDYSSPIDTVYSGYGPGTGGLQYENFEYEPETGTEYVVTPDPEPTKPGMTPDTLP